MATEIKLPELGDGIESGDILQILVSEGDVISKGQSIVEIETDKATVEVPSSKAGRVAKVLVSNGDTVSVGGALISLDTDDASAAAPAKPEKPAATEPPKQEAAADPDEAAEDGDVSEVAEAENADAAKNETESPSAPPAKKPAAASKSPGRAAPAPAKPASSSQSVPASQVPAGPAIRRLAREVGVDLARVKGTGDAGRITRDDVMNVVRKGGLAAQAQDDNALTDSWGSIRVERMSKIRKTIAAKMHESWTTAPRVTNFDDADVTKLEQIRQSSKSDYAEKGIKLTSMPFIIKAVSMALRDHPLINASLDLDNGNIVYKEYVNIGIAVDTERGLMVPSLRRADKLAIPDIARELMQVAEKVRNNSFSLDDLRGSTFTISNLGAIGGTYSTPIISVPEVAILLVGRSRKMPVVADDEVQIRLMMPLSLSYDHRLVDGGAAARFLNDVIGFLAAPSRLLLAP